ncbi:hypothetical protein V6R21_20020 [Limibacter armeniacum]|uniref:hypothetical protein n=1 Tax=Limibacter armeniacum TaxID=466084 RepID=UPI002FE5D427
MTDSITYQIQSLKLKSNSKHLLMQIVRLYQSGQSIDLRNLEYARYIGVCERTITNCLNELEQIGILVISKRKSQYRSMVLNAKKLSQLLGQKIEQVRQIVKEVTQSVADTAKTVATTVKGAFKPKKLMLENDVQAFWDQFNGQPQWKAIYNEYWNKYHEGRMNDIQHRLRTNRKCINQLHAVSNGQPNVAAKIIRDAIQANDHILKIRNGVSTNTSTPAKQEIKAKAIPQPVLEVIETASKEVQEESLSAMKKLLQEKIARQKQSKVKPRNRKPW